MASSSGFPTEAFGRMGATTVVVQDSLVSDMFESFQAWQANFTYAVGETPLSTWQAAGATIAGYLALLVVIKRYVKVKGPRKLKSIFVGAYMSAAKGRRLRLESGQQCCTATLYEAASNESS